jgi:hypothetical protein
LVVGGSKIKIRIKIRIGRGRRVTGRGRSRTTGRKGREGRKPEIRNKSESGKARKGEAGRAKSLGQNHGEEVD